MKHWTNKGNICVWSENDVQVQKLYYWVHELDPDLHYQAMDLEMLVLETGLCSPKPWESVCLKRTELTAWMTPVIAIAKIQRPLERMLDFKQHSQRSFSGVIFETGSHSVLSIARNLLCHTGCWPTGAVPVSAAWELGSQAYSTVAGSWEFSFPFCDRVLFYLPGASSIVILFSG